MNRPNPTAPEHLQPLTSPAEVTESVSAAENPEISPLSDSAADALPSSCTSLPAEAPVSASFTAPAGIPADVSASIADDAPASIADDEPPVPPVPDTLPAPSEQTLMNELAPLRAQYPRMDIPAVIASDAFRDFGESVGWDSRELTARLPALIEASRILSLAVEPPVSRVTAAACTHRRPLLSPGQQKELAAWNRDYPAYRMTELEYFNALGK